MRKILESVSTPKTPVGAVQKQYCPLVEAVYQATGTRPALATILRWCTIGAHGRVLASVKIGGKRMTTIDDVQAFIVVYEGK